MTPMHVVMLIVAILLSLLSAVAWRDVPRLLVGAAAALLLLGVSVAWWA